MTVKNKVWTGVHHNLDVFWKLNSYLLILLNVLYFLSQSILANIICIF